MDSERFKNIIQEYLRGGLSEEAKEKVDRWYQAVSSEEVEPFAHAQNRDRIKAEILAGLPIPQRQEKKIIKLQRRRWIAVAALVMLTGLGSALFFYKRDIHHEFLQQNQLTEVLTLPGDVRTVKLPDSSTIFLSGNAKLRFQAMGFQDARKIYLDQGEAFFDVKRDSLHPFSIEAGAVDIEVLGTSFNVNNTRARQQVEVGVKTGRVRVTAKENDQEHILTAGKGLRYHTKEQLFTSFNTNPAHINIWTTGGIMLDGASFDDLQDLLATRYGMQLKANGLDTKKFSYSLLIPKVESVDQMLNMICTIHELKFRRNENEIILYK